jgi:hypothetical protein
MSDQHGLREPRHEAVVELWWLLMNALLRVLQDPEVPRRASFYEVVRAWLKDNGCTAAAASAGAPEGDLQGDPEELKKAIEALKLPFPPRGDDPDYH